MLIGLVILAVTSHLVAAYQKNLRIYIEKDWYLPTSALFTPNPIFDQSALQL